MKSIISILLTICLFSCFDAGKMVAPTRTVTKVSGTWIKQTNSHGTKTNKGIRFLDSANPGQWFYKNPAPEAAMRTIDSTIYDMMPIPAYIGVGRSNMTGQANNTSLTAHNKLPINNAFVPVPFGKPEPEFRILQAGINNQGLTGDSTFTTHGFEITFMDAMATHYGDTVVLVKYSRGSTPIGDWDPDDGVTSSDLDWQFGKSLLAIETAKALAYERGWRLDFKTLVFWNCEAQNASEYAIYQSTMQKIITQYRVRLGLPNLRFILIKSKSFDPTYGPLIRGLIDGFATADPTHIRTVDTQDLHVNGLHVDLTGQQTVGTRAAAQELLF